MSLGTGIFLAAVVIGLVMLFSATKDRWNWWKGFKRLGIGLIVLIGIGVGIYFGFKPIRELIDRPKPFQEMAGVKRGESQADAPAAGQLPPPLAGANSSTLDAVNRRRSASS